MEKITWGGGVGWSVNPCSAELNLSHQTLSGLGLSLISFLFLLSIQGERNVNGALLAVGPLF